MPKKKKKSLKEKLTASASLTKPLLGPQAGFGTFPDISVDIAQCLQSSDDAKISGLDASQKDVKQTTTTALPSTPSLNSSQILTKIDIESTIGVPESHAFVSPTLSLPTPLQIEAQTHVIIAEDPKVLEQPSATLTLVIKSKADILAVSRNLAIHEKTPIETRALSSTPPSQHRQDPTLFRFDEDKELEQQLPQHLQKRASDETQVINIPTTDEPTSGIQQIPAAGHHGEEGESLHSDEAHFAEPHNNQAHQNSLRTQSCRQQLSCWQLFFSALSAIGSSFMQVAQTYVAYKIVQGVDLEQAPVSRALSTLGALTVLPFINKSPLYYQETNAMFTPNRNIGKYLWQEFVERPLPLLVTITAMTAEAFIVSNSLRELFSSDGVDSVVFLSIGLGTACAMQLLFSEGRSFKLLLEEGLTSQHKEYNDYLDLSPYTKPFKIFAVHFIPVADAIGAMALAFVESRELVEAWMGANEDDQLKAHVSGTVACLLASIYCALHYALYGHKFKKILIDWFFSPQKAPQRGGLSYAERYPRLVRLLYVPMALGALVHGSVYMAASGQLYRIFTSKGLRSSPVSSPIILCMLSIGIPAAIQSFAVEGRGLWKLVHGNLLQHPPAPVISRSSYRIEHLLLDALRVTPLILFRWLIQSAFFNSTSTSELSDSNRLYIYFLSTGGAVFSWAAIVEVKRLMKKRPEPQHYTIALEDEKGSSILPRTEDGKHQALEYYRTHVHHENERKYYRSWERLISQGILQAFIGTLLGAYTEALVQKKLSADEISDSVALTDALVVGSIFSGWTSVFASRLWDYAWKVYWFKVEEAVELFTEKSVKEILAKSEYWPTLDPQSTVSRCINILSLPKEEGEIADAKSHSAIDQAITFQETSCVTAAYDAETDDWALIKLKKLEAKEQPQNYWQERDLVLASMEEWQKITVSKIEEFLHQNKRFQGKPILIKQGKTFSLYDQSETGKWQIIPNLDADKLNQLEFNKNPIEPILSNKLEEKEKLIIQLSIFKARKDEILRKIAKKNYHSRLDKELELRLKAISQIEEKLKNINKKEDYEKQKSPSIKMMDLRPIPTKGDGECAFHAILGKWDVSARQIVCADVKEKRAQLRKAIINVENKELLQGLIEDGIKELIMSGRVIGESSQELLKMYQKFLSDQKELSSEAWKQFEKILKKYEVIIEYIESNHRITITADLRAKFYDALNKNDGKLYGCILSLPDLYTAFQEYNQLQDTAFDWIFTIKKLKHIKQEYADFAGTSQMWLLPSELALIAHVFDVSVIYYPSPQALPFTLNPAGSSIVEVQFDGVDHFQRLQSDQYGFASILPSHQVSSALYQEIISKQSYTHWQGQFYSPTNNYSFWNKTKKTFNIHHPNQKIEWRRPEGLIHPITRLDSAPWVLAQLHYLVQHDRLTSQPQLRSWRQQNTIVVKNLDQHKPVQENGHAP